MITVITGHIRVGKTSFMTAKAVEAAQNGEKRRKMLAAVSNLKRRGYNVSEAKYALYSNFKISYNNHRGVSFNSIRVDPRKLFIGEEAVYIRPYSVLAISEAQTFFNARAFQHFTPEQARFFQTSGHFGVDIFMDTQDIETLDKTLRGLCDIYDIKKRIIYNNRGREVDQAEERDVSKIIFKYEYRPDIYSKPQAGTFKIDYNVFEFYNSFECYDDYLPQKKGTII